MKKVIGFVLLISLFLFVFSCKPQKQCFLNVQKIKIIDFGKICLNNDELKILSNFSNISERKLTSALYLIKDNKKECYPINDKTFDYSLFQKKRNTSKNGELTILYRKITINNKDYIVVYNVKNE